MRRPLYLNPKQSAQQGFALFIVLMMMVVIALLVVAATQSYNTEQRISSNDADRKFAMTLSEAALRQGENAIFELDFENNPVAFTTNCDNGLCAALGSSSPASQSNITVSLEDNESTPAWERNCDDGLCIDTKGIEYSANGAAQNPRYILEFIKIDNDGAAYFRVTSKAWGRNANTVVMTQSYVAYE